MKTEELKTDRLVLRKFTPETFDDIYQNLSDQELLENLGLNSNEQLLQEREKYEAGLHTHNKRFLYFLLVDKFSKKVVGWAGYHTWYTDHDRAELGYELFDTAYRGKGFMSEALRVIIDFGFKKMGLNRIEAFIGPNNTASLNLINKFKFVKEGQMRRHYRKNDRFEDSVVYSLLREEYAAVE